MVFSPLRGLPTLPIPKRLELNGDRLILDENEYYDATEGIVYGAGIAD